MIIYTIIDKLFMVYYIVLIIYILSSWFPNFRGTPIGTLLEKLSEPYLSVFRRIIPPIGGLDLSPILALFVLHYVQMGLFTVISWIL